MRTILLAVFLVASSFTLYAQYTGGSSDGDDVSTASDLLFTGSTATATSLLFLTHPANTTVWTNDVSAIVDVVGSNNLQMGGSTNITISLANNPGSATVGGTATLSSSGGRASFTGLYLDRSGTGYTLAASASGLNSATGNAFNVAAASLAISTQPPSYTYANQSFGLQVNVVDANGTILNLANPTLNLSIATNPGSATLSGTTSVQATAGRVAFSGLSLNNVGSGYVLQIANPDMNSVNTNAFDVLSSSLFRGGNSDGDDVGTYTATLPVSGHIFWVGGLGVTPTAWNDPLNWFPNTAVPGSSDRLAMEPNNNGHNPILDQDRTIYSMNFNGADKKLELGNHTLTLTADATGVNSSNYFKTNGSGKLKRPSLPNNEGFTFPVGNSAYNPIAITNRTGTAEWFSVRVLDEIYEYGTFGNANTEPRVKRTWDIDKQTPSANAGNGVDFTFNWNANEVSSPAPQNYTLFHHDANGNGWAEVVTGTRDINFNPAANSMIWTGYKGSFSPFGVGDQNAPLPVELLYFTAECKPQGTSLNWATASEVNSAYFELQRSTDLIHWSVLKKVTALGFHSSEYTYPEVLDASQYDGVRYYRLRQVDFDGKQEYFQPVAADCPNSGMAVSIYPNPASEQLRIQGAEPGSDWEIFDVSARSLLRGKIHEEGTELISVLSLPAGLYHMHLQNRVFPFVVLE
jgi:hypothetical protein